MNLRTMMLCLNECAYPKGYGYSLINRWSYKPEEHKMSNFYEVTKWRLKSGEEKKSKREESQTFFYPEAEEYVMKEMDKY